MGTMDTFVTYGAPANLIETVNTMGQRLYSKQFPAPNGKSTRLETQTNALHYCTRPKVLMTGVRAD